MVNDIDSFEWDDDSTFQEEEPKEVVTTTEKTKAEEVDNDINSDNFSNTFDDTIDDVVVDNDKTIQFQSTINRLKESQILTIEVVEGDTEETVYERQLESDVNTAITTLFEDVKRNSEAVLLLKHLRAGGTVSDFVKNPISVTTDATTDKEKESALIHYYMRKRNMDDDEAGTFVDALKNNGKLETTYDKIKESIESERIEQEKELEQRTVEQKQKQLNLYKERRSNMATLINDKTFDFGGLGRNKKDASKDKEVIDFVLTPDSNTNRTKLVDSISNLYASKDYSKLLMLGKILATDFNFDNLKAIGGSNTTKIIKDNIQRTTPTITNGVNTNRKGNNIADLFAGFD